MTEAKAWFWAILRPPQPPEMGSNSGPGTPWCPALGPRGSQEQGPARRAVPPHHDCSEDCGRGIGPAPRFWFLPILMLQSTRGKKQGSRNRPVTAPLEVS